MSSSEQSPFDEIALGVEIELVTAQLGVMDEIIFKYPNLAGTFKKAKDELLSDPAAYFAKKAKSMESAREHFPALYKLMVEDTMDSDD